MPGPGVVEWPTVKLKVAWAAPFVVRVPANVVEIVRRATAKEVQQAYNSGFYEFGGEQLPFFWSGGSSAATSVVNVP